MNFKKLIFIILFVCALGTEEKLFSAAQTPPMRDVVEINEPDYIFESLDDLGLIPLPGQEKDFLELPVSEEGSIVSPVEIIDVDNEVKIIKNKKRKRSDNTYLPIHAVIHSPKTLNESVAQPEKKANTLEDILKWLGYYKIILNILKEKDLDKHKKIHPKKESFKCKVCPETFDNNGGLVNHQKLVHKIHIIEKPFKCEKCDKSFTQKRNLNTHLKTHIKTLVKKHILLIKYQPKLEIFYQK